MRPENVRELVERDPFVPFRIQLSSGDHIDITAQTQRSRDAN